ncbi:MAG: hypothetical protein FJZ11_00995 [Candidatus Omnitrophica bacterium]|nr:hypothetical protein [Candidatus Omnitrophota bacterium]
MATEPVSTQNSVISILLSCVPTLIGVGVGYWLGLIGESRREKRNKDNLKAELLRALLQEISGNRIKCQTISTHQDATSYLESYIWDRIRTSDVLYCITAGNADLYQKIIAVYMGVQNINLRIAANVSALDAFIRSGGVVGADMMNKTYAILREAVIAFLPQLTDLENSLKDFLIAGGFFRQPKVKA